MIRRIRIAFAALAVASLLTVPSVSLAGTKIGKIGNMGTPIPVDLFIQRPVGFGMLAVSAAAFVPAAAITYATRKEELPRIWDFMVMNQVRYVFIDPIGSH